VTTPALLLDPPAPSPVPAPIQSRTLAERLWPALPADRAVSWIVTVVITGFGALLRWPSLGTPHAFSFDETYYAKDAFSLLVHGFEQSFRSDADQTILASNGDPATLHKVFLDSPEFVVHPPVGKWVIAIGEHFFGVTPFGWRFMVAVLGTLAIALVVRVGRRLTRSTLIGGVAGFLLAIDGQAIVHSRTGLLDPILMFWVLVAFAALVLDRDRTRRRLADRVRSFDSDRAALRSLGAGFGPRLGLRPWRWVAGVAIGLACGTKWSGVWFLVAFGLLTVFWDVSTRRLIGVQRPYAATFERTVPAAFFWIAVVALLVYLASWSGWLLTSGGWDRQWALANPATGLWGHVPDALRSLWHYHAEALSFNENLTTPHTYQSNPWGWPLQARPTSYYFQSPTLGQDGCTVDKCASEVVALGNPIIWWAGALALLHQAWRWVGRRDWRSGAVVAGFLAGWVPWLFFQHRTIFTFYVVAYLPFLMLATAMTLGTVAGPVTASANRRAVGAAAVGVVLLGAVVAAWWFYPIWAAQVVPYSQWEMRMWFPTWV
jgi:dolichyl-phosphate-mannose--protein O-mannosyl transferase